MFYGMKFDVPHKKASVFINYHEDISENTAGISSKQALFYQDSFQSVQDFHILPQAGFL